MSKPLIYIDQNIVGMQLSGLIDLKSHSDFYWVYSSEHFSEIRRSSNFTQYLSVLEKIGAKFLRLELDSNWKITGNAQLIEDGTPTQHYADYIDSINEVDFDETLFDPFQAWVNGGGDEQRLAQLPKKLEEQLSSLISDFSLDNSLLNERSCINSEFNDCVEKIIKQGNNIQDIRRAFGDGKGGIGGIKGKNQIEQIWGVIGSVCGGVTCDQFFAFDPIDKQGYTSWPIYLGIVGCCAILDIVGFQSEQKCRKLEKIPNIRSDSHHIAMGAFCSSILSNDRKLVKRAKAIYEYKNINTSAILVERLTNS